MNRPVLVALGLATSLAGCGQAPCIAVQPMQLVAVHPVGNWDSVARSWSPLASSPACRGVDALPSDFSLVARRLTQRPDRRLCSVVEMDLASSVGLPDGTAVPVAAPGDLEGGSIVSTRAIVDGCAGRWLLVVTPRNPGDSALVTETAGPPAAPPFTVTRTWERESADGACAMAVRCSDVWGAEVRVGTTDAGGEG